MYDRECKVSLGKVLTVKNVQHVATMSYLLGVYTVHYHKGDKIIARVNYSGLSPFEVHGKVVRDIRDFIGLDYHSFDAVFLHKVINFYAA